LKKALCAPLVAYKIIYTLPYLGEGGLTLIDFHWQKGRKRSSQLSTQDVLPACQLDFMVTR
jgi:hypothetical protein